MVDKAAADAAKALGNKAFQAGDDATAIKHFTDAIGHDPSNHVLYSNRSGAYLRSKAGDKALADAESCIEKNSAWAKGYTRKGAALHALGRFEDSIAAYEKAISIDPKDAWKNELQQVRQAASARAGGAPGGGQGLFGQDAIARLMMNPETKDFLKDPDFMQKLQLLQSNPQNISMMQSDPRIMKALSVMLGMPMDGAPGGPGPADEPAPKQTKVEPEPEPEVELTPEEQDAAALKAKADAEKALGTAAYKKKDFPTALKHYGAAHELLPTEMTYISNQASVYLEMKDYETCIKKCEEAYEVGRENRVPYKMLAKVLARQGTAYERSGDLQQAVHWYNKALAEDRTADVLKKRQDAEKKMKQQAKAEYRDEAKAEEAKLKGNELWKAGNFSEAVKLYTEAIERNPDDVKPRSNRAACYIKLLALPQAVEDCDIVIKADPTFIKGYTRKGDALFLMKRHEEAKIVYNEALAIDKNNESARDGLSRCLRAIREKEANMSKEERQQRAMKDPEVQEIMRDPVMNSVLEQMQSDPRAAQEHMKNPSIAAKIQKLMDAGIIGYK